MPVQYFVYPRKGVKGQESATSTAKPLNGHLAAELPKWESEWGNVARLTSQKILVLACKIAGIIWLESFLTGFGMIEDDGIVA